MFRNFYADEYYKSTYDIDFKRYHQNGFRAILFDIDNTLVGHDSPCDERAAKLIDELKECGFKVCVVSNNSGLRAGSFAKEAGCEYVSDAGKPSSRGYKRAMKMLGVRAKETMMIGDQMFTDIWGAHNAGIYSILVKQIGPDPTIKIRLKRVCEGIIFPFYKRYLSKK